MTTSKIDCHSCGSSLLPNTRFCTQCGAQVSGPIHCPRCKVSVPAGSRFCTSCGTAMLSDDQVVMGNRWARRADDFATRLEMSDLSASLKRGIAVDEGTRGLLFQHGALVGILEPGLHTLETVVDRLNSLVTTSPCSVVLVDGSSVDLRLNAAGLRTSDDQEVSATLQIVVALHDAKSFFNNLMKGAQRLTTAELSQQLTQQTLSILQAIVLDCTATELYGNRELADRIEDELRAHLMHTLVRYGLQFDTVEFVSFGGTAFDEIRRERGETLAGEARFDVQQRRSALNRKFDELLTDERMKDIQNQADFDDFVKQVEQESGIKELLRTQEREELWRQYNEKKEDHSLARAHVLATLKWQQKREQLAGELHYQRDLLAMQHELDDAERAHRSRKLDDEQQSELGRLQRDHNAELRRLDDKRKSDLAHDAAKFDRDFEQTQKEADLGIALQEKWENIKHQRGVNDIERTLFQQRGEQEIRQADDDGDHRRQIERLQTLSSMSVEALIAASPTDQAQILASLKETEALKGLSEEQILARAAADSPEVAKAFAEKFRNVGAQESQQQMQQMYERMLEQHAQHAHQTTAAQQESTRMLKDLMETALKTQRDTSVATAQGSAGRGPSVIYPPAGSGPATVFGGSQSPQHPGTPGVNCPECRQQTHNGAAFCGRCGYRFS